MFYTVRAYYYATTTLCVYAFSTFCTHVNAWSSCIIQNVPLYYSIPMHWKYDNNITVYKEAKVYS